MKLSDLYTGLVGFFFWKCFLLNHFGTKLCFSTRHAAQKGTPPVSTFPELGHKPITDVFKYHFCL